MPPVAVTFHGPRSVGFVEEPARPLEPGQVRLRTLYSGISTGTEMTAYRGTNPYLHKLWDPDRRLFIDAREQRTLSYPVIGWGYEEVGEVVEVAEDVGDLSPGSVVYGTWGHRTECIVSAEYARKRILADGVDPIYGVFSQLGAIALNGVLDAAIRLGETVAVFGLGVVGQLVAQLARLSGATVVGVDLLPARLETARTLGVDIALDGSAGSPAEQIKEHTSGRGADVCIEASGATSALNEAIRAAAYSSKVVAMGFFQGPAGGLFLGEEFHHNRVNIVGSQIGGVAPDLQHRWNTDRLVHTFMRLVETRQLQLQPLITHTMPAREAPILFDLLDRELSSVLQAVLDFRDGIPSTTVSAAQPGTQQ
ncbi:MAG: zinc-binding alcohol dehydrogenase [Chloroflexota bacterium]|nr:zinc-binding alcohol dehydrogenase [Chloroflexota bacterium]